MKNLSLIICFSILTIGIYGSEVTIEDIIKKPQSYEKEKVTFTGIVTQYIEGTESSTSHYLIKGDFGGQIRVNTAEGSPETYSKYTVTGIVYFDVKTGTIFISEKSREPIVLVDDKSVNDPSGPTLPDTGNNLLRYLIITGVALAIILVILLLVRKSKKSSSPKSYESNSEAYNKNDDDDFQTIKISKSTDPKTIKLIPGRLKIISGADAGKVFRIAGLPTAEGDIITIGRESVNGDNKYSHIQLMEKTVSRKQAMLIYSKGKLYVKNLSETNFTLVDGIELKPGENLEIKPNSTIKTGEVEFQYIV